MSGGREAIQKFDASVLRNRSDERISLCRVGLGAVGWSMEPEAGRAKWLPKRINAVAPCGSRFRLFAFNGTTEPCPSRLGGPSRNQYPTHTRPAPGVPRAAFSEQDNSWMKKATGDAGADGEKIALAGEDFDFAGARELG